MIYLKNFVLKNIFILLLLISAAGFEMPAFSQTRSDILLGIVSNCINPNIANYCSVCSLARNDSACNSQPECKKSIEVWALNQQFTAMRDIKMCGCPASFVHGLALPLKPVTGVEDPARPEGIWQFAWDEAVKRMPLMSIALVVNPRLERSQNQLHVHMLRLRDGQEALLAENVVAHVGGLDQVWATAAKGAAQRGLLDYGVLVASRAEGDFMVVVTASSPEDRFTQYRCD